MDTFRAFLDYFTPLQWTIIGVSFAVLLRVAEWLTDRYFKRKAEKRKQERQRLSSEDASRDNTPRV
ncbi:phage holin [Cedecea neteri]|uniref:phage holin n=1 Tax=Cedecea neteri TaxID=158822 RepID=UPI002AA94458|nr:phage holin [Cedecea neteri]WPU22573.1 phage holin [Cedecea neteri]